MTEEIRSLLLDILGNHERFDKLSIVLEPVSRNVAVCVRDLDQDDFELLRELTRVEQPSSVDPRLVVGFAIMGEGEHGGTIIDGEPLSLWDGK